jgi:hypothetical protein
MRNLVIVTPLEVSEEMLKVFVAEQGGSWNDEQELRQGVILREQGVVYVSTGFSLDREFEDEELKSLVERYGFQPVGMIDLHFSSVPDSTKLAEDIGQALLAKWGGVVLSS